jgi:peptidoglycan hydrolase CwlO-like protein
MRYVVVFFMILLNGCVENAQQEPANTNEYAKVDSIIGESQQHLTIADRKIKESDSLVTEKIEKTAEKIHNLESEVKQLKQENNDLKTKLNIMDDDGEPFTLRTISDN